MSSQTRIFIPVLLSTISLWSSVSCPVLAEISIRVCSPLLSMSSQTRIFIPLLSTNPGFGCTNAARAARRRVIMRTMANPRPCPPIAIDLFSSLMRRCRSNGSNSASDSANRTPRPAPVSLTRSHSRARAPRPPSNATEARSESSIAFHAFVSTFWSRALHSANDPTGKRSCSGMP